MIDGTLERYRVIVGVHVTRQRVRRDELLGFLHAQDQRRQIDGPNEPLFPRIDRKKTWLIVKKDLARVDISFQDDQGRIADFHAAGRHTHITELLRNGVSLPEAKELARHSDVRMTMRYTHIGINDQADALASLPSACQHLARRRWSQQGTG